jgi:hypothetical protein
MYSNHETIPGPICFHFNEEGLPPNCWADRSTELKIKNAKGKSLCMLRILREVTEEI